MRTFWRTFLRILGVLLVFLFGVLFGAAATNAGIAKKVRELMMGGPEAAMDIVVRRLDSELKLDPEQKRKLQTIVDDAHIKLRQSRAKIQPEVDATLHEAEERARAILYPNQIEKFDQLLNRSKEKWKEVRRKELATPAPEAQQGSAAKPEVEAKPQKEAESPPAPATPAPKPAAED